MDKKQQLNFFSVTMIVVSLIIGMGIFKTPSTIAAKSGTETIFFTAWIIGGFIALCGALTYAEIGSRLPVIGGYYKIFAHCYHPAVGFTVNVLILVSNAASLAVVALIGADYVSDFLYGQPSGIIFNAAVAATAVALFYGVNLFGLKTSSRTQNFLTVVKIALILLLISALFTGIRVLPHGYNDGKIYNFNGNNTLLLLIISLVAVSFTYGGYQQTINFGGEVKSSSTLQRGIVWGILISVFLYISINYAYIKVIGFEQMKNANAIGALLCEAWFGTAGAKVFDLCMILSVLAYVNVILLSNPRVMYAMSKDGILPGIFTYQHPKTKALVPALTVYAILTAIIVLVGKGVDDVLSFSIFLDSIGMSTSAATIFILRKKKTGEENVTGGIKKIIPALAVIFVLAYTLVAAAVIIDKPFSALTGAGLLVLFAVLYFVFYHAKKSEL